MNDSSTRVPEISSAAIPKAIERGSCRTSVSLKAIATPTSFGTFVTKAVTRPGCGGCSESPIHDGRVARSGCMGSPGGVRFGRVKRSVTLGLVVLVLGASESQAQAVTRPLLAPPRALSIKTAHRMAERWAIGPKGSRHTTVCHRASRTVAWCHIHYSKALLEGTDENGRRIALWGTGWERVTIRRYAHRIVLTSNFLRGRLVQRG
jgi:hypothetical protein